MNKHKLLLGIIAILLITNALLGYFLLFRKPHRPMGPRNVIIERLQFDAQQVQNYDRLIANHRKQISAQDAKMRALQKQLYQTLKHENAPLTTDSLAVEIGKAATATEKIHYAHFEDIKALCREGQKEKFDALISELDSLFMHKPPKRQKNN